MRWITGVILVTLLSGCDATVWNDPNQKESGAENVGYTSFSESPKTLDPVKSYTVDENIFLAQIYEPVLQYHLLKRPFQLVPATAVRMPEVTYLDKNKTPLSKNIPVQDIAYSMYDIYITPGILYQPHPAFAKDENNNFRYLPVIISELTDISSLSDFKYTGTRELTAHDYVYEIKRIADPHLQCPIYGVMEKHIVGLSELHQKLEKLSGHIDLRQFDLSGVRVIDDYHYQILINGKYPQFNYWLAMPFFAPIPWEADEFYAQPGMGSRNLNFDWYPVGTGPYYLSENNPNRQMVLTRNPNFHPEYFPAEGDPGDAEAGYLIDAGKRLPFLDKYVFSLEKETVPRWNKFLQGYYDKSAISSDAFDQAILVDSEGNVSLTPEMKDKKIYLQSDVSASIFYYGFNMLDPIVGGNTPRAKKLRQAISIAIDFKEYVAIFLNERGVVAEGPLPPGIFGYEPPKNATVNHDLNYAKQLLSEAGYPDGMDEKTGKPLVLNFDVASSGGPDDNARFDWTRKQFAKLGIQLQVQDTQYNRFQKKMRTGDFQIYFWGWNADYPDPENFLFLFYGPNGKVKFDGENASNYANPEFDQLFEKMKNMDNTPERRAIIQRMVQIVQDDAPWVFGFFPKDYVLNHHWCRINKPNSMANNLLKYARLNPVERAASRKAWNHPVTWPIIIFIFVIMLVILPVFISYWRRQHRHRSHQE